MPNVITVATGVPPHTKIIKDLNEFATKLHYLSSKLDNIYVGLNRVVSGAIEDNMASNQYLFADTLGRRIYEFQIHGNILLT